MPARSYRNEPSQAAKIFGAMDPGETPGVRASVDSCEVLLDLTP